AARPHRAVGRPFDTENRVTAIVRERSDIPANWIEPIDVREAGTGSEVDAAVRSDLYGLRIGYALCRVALDQVAVGIGMDDVVRIRLSDPQGSVGRDIETERIEEEIGGLVIRKTDIRKEGAVVLEVFEHTDAAAERSIDCDVQVIVGAQFKSAADAARVTE